MPDLIIHYSVYIRNSGSEMRSRVVVRNFVVELILCVLLLLQQVDFSNANILGILHTVIVVKWISAIGRDYKQRTRYESKWNWPHRTTFKFQIFSRSARAMYIGIVGMRCELAYDSENAAEYKHVPHKHMH